MRRVLLVSVLLLLVSFVPVLILGKDAYVLIHDNLDSEFVYYHVLKESGNLFNYDSSAVVPQVFNGLNTRYFHSEFSLIRLFFYALPSFWAYWMNSLLVRLIGLLGMFLL